MSMHNDEPFDPARPALIVTVGNTARKHRALNHDVVVLGRAHGCDIGLTAPDVSSIHCLIYRSPDGLRIRDCQSRSGTHVNGQAIQEVALRDGDTIQVGPFSFQAYLPAESTPWASGTSTAAEVQGSPGSRDPQRLQNSRRRLAQLALNLRRRLKGARSSDEEQTALADRQAELDQQAEFLRTRAREYDQRARKLEEAERTLAAERTAYERADAEREQRLRQAESELLARQAALEEEVESQWAAWQRFQEERDQVQHELEAERARLPRARDFHTPLDPLGLLQDELAGHRRLTGVEGREGGVRGDTPVPSRWRNMQEGLAPTGP